MNRKTLSLQMLSKGGLGIALLGALLMGSAGSLSYARGWMFLIALTMLMLALGLALLMKAPETLARRLKSKESEPAQRRYVAAIGVMFIASFVLAGLDHRFGWSRMPLGASIAALAVMVAGYGLYAAVMLHNAYASRVVEVQRDQALITTGLYSVVRHPLYLAALLLFLSAPFALGSYFAAIPMILFPIALVLRIRSEEALLIQELAGYSEYVKATKYRLIPRIW